MATSDMETSPSGLKQIASLLCSLIRCWPHGHWVDRKKVFDAVTHAGFGLGMFSGETQNLRLHHFCVLEVCRGMVFHELS